MTNVNAHLHTPWSFSAFDSVGQALDMAAAQNVKVVGINDFYSTDGYAEWTEGCHARKLFPLFNIEMISLDEQFQREGLRVNDPGNPGRTYLSGKGLANPPHIAEPYASRLAAVREESNAQVRAMCAKLNAVLGSVGAGFSLDIKEIEKTLTKGNIRERHIAKALRLAVYERAADDAERKALLEKIFGGKALKSSAGDFAGVENEIRSNLLKAGGAAFVPEEPKAFLPMEEVVAIIEAAGGIPTYPFFADDINSNFTDFEGDLPKAAAILKSRGIHNVEFITTRNSVEVLECYSQWLWNNGFTVTFGSEHNSPAMEPVELFARGGAELTPFLKEINYKGACIVAAHQEIYARTGMLYDPSKRGEYVTLGDKLIQQAIR